MSDDQEPYDKLYELYKSGTYSIEDAMAYLGIAPAEHDALRDNVRRYLDSFPTSSDSKIVAGVDPAFGPDKTGVVVGKIHQGNFKLIEVSLIKAEDVVYPHPTGSILCNVCGGTGTEILFQLRRECPTCEGTGWLGGKARVATANVKVQLKKPAEHITLNFALPGSWAWAQLQMEEGKKVRRKVWRAEVYTRYDQDQRVLLCEKDPNFGELISLSSGEAEDATDWELFTRSG